MPKARRSSLTMTGICLKKFPCFSNKIKGNIDKCTILAITTLGKTQRMLRMVFGNISFKRGRYMLYSFRMAARNERLRQQHLSSHPALRFGKLLSVYARTRTGRMSDKKRTCRADKGVFR